MFGKEDLREHAIAENLHANSEAAILALWISSLVDF